MKFECLSLAPLAGDAPLFRAHYKLRYFSTGVCYMQWSLRDTVIVKWKKKSHLFCIIMRSLTFLPQENESNIHIINNFNLFFFCFGIFFYFKYGTTCIEQKKTTTRGASNKHTNYCIVHWNANVLILTCRVLSDHCGIYLRLQSSVLCDREKAICFFFKQKENGKNLHRSKTCGFKSSGRQIKNKNSWSCEKKC